MLFEEIREIICEQLDIEKDLVKVESTFEEIDADSLDMFQIVIEIEEKYDIQIKEIEGLKSIKDLIKYVEENK